MKVGVKVCVLATSYPRNLSDHASPFVHGLSRALKQKGVEVVVVAPHAPGLALHDALEGVRIERFRYAWPAALEQLAYGYGIPENIRYHPWTILLIPFFLLGLFFCGLRHSRGADVIHVHWELAALAGWVIGKIRQIPVVFTVHRLVARRPWSRALTRFLLRRMDQLHFNSTYTQREAALLLGTEPRGEIIPPSIAWEDFESPRVDADFRRRWQLPENRPLIVSVGRMVEKKGFRFLIEAYAQLRGKHSSSPLLVIAGGGPLLEELRGAARQGSPNGDIYLPGFVSPADIRALLSQATLAVFPSIVDSRGEVETLGVAAIEALACGLPVIASRVGGLVDVVQHEKTGILVEPGKVEELAQAMLRLLADSQKAARLGSQGRQFVRENFTWDTTVSRTLAAYGKNRPNSVE